MYVLHHLAAMIDHSSLHFAGSYPFLNQTTKGRVYPQIFHHTLLTYNLGIQTCPKKEV